MPYDFEAELNEALAAANAERENNSDERDSDDDDDVEVVETRSFGIKSGSGK